MRGQQGGWGGAGYGNSTYGISKVPTLFLFIVWIYSGPQQLLYLFRGQEKHSASARVCTLHKVCEQQGEATRVQGVKRFHKALQWPLKETCPIPCLVFLHSGSRRGREPIPAVVGGRFGLHPGPAASLSHGYIERQTAVHTCANLLPI